MIVHPGATAVAPALVDGVGMVAVFNGEKTGVKCL